MQCEGETGGDVLFNSQPDGETAERNPPARPKVKPDFPHSPPSPPPRGPVAGGPHPGGDPTVLPPPLPPPLYPTRCPALSQRPPAGPPAGGLGATRPRGDRDPPSGSRGPHPVRYPFDVSPHSIGLLPNIPLQCNGEGADPPPPAPAAVR